VASDAEAPEGRATGWLTQPVRGIGAASFFADLGHEIPTALLPGLLTGPLGASAAALGVIEGVADGLAGAAKLAGGALADDPERRRTVAVGGYAATAVLSALIGAAGAVWQVAVLRACAWAARGVRGPARNALLADAVEPQAYGRAYGFERALDNLGAVGGPLLAIVLVALAGVRSAILLSVVPGLVSAAAILYAVRHLPRETRRERQPIRLKIRPVLRGRLARLMVGISAFEFGNVAATLLILRATELLEPASGLEGATLTALALYTGYNAAATGASFPAGQLGDRFGATRVLFLGVALFAGAYLAFALAGPNLALLGVAFLAAGVGIGAVETAEHSVVASSAPQEVRGSAFGLLAGVQSVGNLAASVVAGVLWAALGATAAFLFAAALMVLAATGLLAAGLSPPIETRTPSATG
jgi:MFS family permease